MSEILPHELLCVDFIHRIIIFLHFLEHEDMLFIFNCYNSP